MLKNKGVLYIQENRERKKNIDENDTTQQKVIFKIYNIINKFITFFFFI